MIDRLAYLIAAARERSFRRAAESCGVAQPTLSAGIKQLEDELGVLLIRRSSRFHGLTPEGERVLEWARRIVGDARSMRQELHGMRTGLSGHLRIATIPTALAVVPTLTEPLADRHPALQFTILSCNSDQILRMLDELEVDAGITYLDNEGVGRVQSVPLYMERYQLVTADPAVFAGRTAVNWAELPEVRLCLLTPDMQNRRIMDRLMRGVGVEPQTTLESNSPVALIAHVLTGRWTTVLPERLAETLASAPQLRRVPVVEPAALYQIGLVLPLREPMPILAAALLRQARLSARYGPL